MHWYKPTMDGVVKSCLNDHIKYDLMVLKDSHNKQEENYMENYKPFPLVVLKIC